MVAGGAVPATSGPLIGRAEERAAIDRLLADARAGRSGVLVLSGAPGVGKSALLASAIDLAGGMRVLQVVGVETEIDLAFAGLDQLVRPVLEAAERLPARQADALLGALGRGDHVSQDRFLVGAATLSLLSEAAEDAPLLCVVDDAQWLDRPSVEALAFAGRRLEAEGIALLAATREGGWAGLPELPVAGLGPDDAAELLHETAGQIAPDVCARLVEETAGNPLALLELVGALSPRQLEGTEPLPRKLALTPRIQEAFSAKVRALPARSRTLLLVAAADDTSDAAVIVRAAAGLGVRPDDLEPVERARLASVDTGGRFAFRHPLVRAAVYQGATFPARLAAHRALAGALEGGEHAERQVWHLAATAIGPDQAIARALQQSAERSERRGGHAVAAAAFERAAELAPARADRGRLFVAAAQAAFRAGQAGRAAGLAARAEPMVDDPAVADELTRLRGRIEFARGSALTAHAMLLAAARGVAERDPRTAATLLIEAARAAWNAHDQDRYAEAAALLTTLRLPEGDPLGPVVATAIAIGDFVAGRPRDPVIRMRQGINAWIPLLRADQRSGHDQEFVEASLALTGFTRVTCDDAAGLAVGTAAVVGCRTRGLVAWLPWALVNLSMTEALAGRHAAAVASATEGLRLAQDLDLPMAVCACTASLAWVAAVRGEEERCRQLADDAVRLAQTHHLPAIAVFATWALGLLELSLGRPERAFERLSDPVHGPMAVPSVRCLITPDLVEAAVRAGQARDLGDTVGWYEEWAPATGQAAAEAALHRCRALLDGDRAEAHFVESLRLHDTMGPAQRPFDRARTELLYGQWLRRVRRRADARPRLASAHETFQRLGATPWAERAATELRATGQTVPRRDAVAAHLTAQEIQVVRLVAEGGSNQEVAAQLFLSPRTVAYHLYKAFPKLGISSRAELAHLDLEELAAGSSVRGR
jgi:DNA-binding CsgD family transcriptional regulator